MNLFDLDSRTQDLRDYWITSKPIPHVVIPKFLKQPESVEFPANDWEHWTPLGDSYQSNKFICSDMSLFPAALRTIFCGLASPELLSFLETTSGIKGLIPDPYLTGGDCTSQPEVVYLLTIPTFISIRASVYTEDLISLFI